MSPSKWGGFPLCWNATADPIAPHPTSKELVPHPPLSQATGLMHLPGEAGKEGVSSVNPDEG